MKPSSYHNYDKSPALSIAGYAAWEGYDAIAKTLLSSLAGKPSCVIVLDCYPEVDQAEVEAGLSSLGAVFYHTDACMMPKEDYKALIQPYVTDDRVFGVMNSLTLRDILQEDKAEAMRAAIRQERQKKSGIICVIGVGASLVTSGDILVYLDLARWEIQCRFQKGAPNWHTDNERAGKLIKFKQGYFVEWRMADRHKRTLLQSIDYLLDTNCPDHPKMVSGDGFRQGLMTFVSRPFRLVPYFAPEVWGGQWMKDVCDLDRRSPNYAWAFDGVPEENSIYMQFGDVRLEVPAIDAVFYAPRKLLGDRVYARFGDEYPIRFDFLDTMGGQNLSLQVHPTTDYIQKTFGMRYTQDESYYILDAQEGASVYLGLKEGIDPAEMLAALEAAQRGEGEFPTERYVNRIPAKPHDHFLIPAGTVHCSGAGTMVLEISATPYIFTFKLWDWARLGLDGLPRPVHLQHGKAVIQWDRTTDWVHRNLVNRFRVSAESADYWEEETGLHESEFIETRRCVIRSRAHFTANGSVQQANVVKGRGAVIESPTGAFAPYEVHYAETFIIPASVPAFTVTPLDGEVTILKAHIRE